MFAKVVCGLRGESQFGKSRVGPAWAVGRQVERCGRPLRLHVHPYIHDSEDRLVLVVPKEDSGQKEALDAVEKSSVSNHVG
jgi:hypothetical protein